MGNQTKFPSVPLVAGLNPPALQQFAQAVRDNINIMNGITGDPLDASVSFRDLASAGVLQIGTGVPAANSQQVAIAAGLMATVSNATDYTPPPAPTNLSASGAMGNAILTWDMPTYANHSYTEIWREQVTFTGGVADASVIGNAVLVGTSSGYVGVYADATGAASDCYYWIKFISTASVAGPFNAVPGTRGTTSADPAYLLSLLTGNPNAHSVIAGFPFTVLTVPTVINGITIPAGVYLNGTMIQDGMITAQHVAAATMTADKMSVAQLSAIAADMGSITAGSMNINNKFIVDAFGNMTATAGSFSGALSAATGTFRGALNAATGTFSGAMTADAVNAVSTINLAGQAVTIPIGASTTVNSSISTAATAKLSASISSSGAPIMITASISASTRGDYYVDGNGATIYTAMGQVFATVSRSGTVISDICSVVRANDGDGAYTFVLKDTPGVGVFTYAINVYHGHANFVSTMLNAGIILLEVKR